MNINEVKDLMKQFDGSSLREFSWKNAEGELGFSKNEGHVAVATSGAAASLTTPVPVMAASNNASETVIEKEISVAHVAEGETVKSPLVGVVYLKSAPDKAEFIKVGDSVKKGQTLLIIEAMKVMNEIPAPKDGIITEIMVGTENVVEFGQELVRIK